MEIEYDKEKNVMTISCSVVEKLQILGHSVRGVPGDAAEVRERVRTALEPVRAANPRVRFVIEQPAKSAGEPNHAP